jgi:hypothetical protein
MGPGISKGPVPCRCHCYGRAIEIDPRFAEAHFKLAQTRMRMSSWMASCQEFRRPVELQPENWQAQLSLSPMVMMLRSWQEATGAYLEELREQRKLA